MSTSVDTEWVSGLHVTVRPTIQERRTAAGEPRFIVKWNVAGHEKSRSIPASPGKRPEAAAQRLQDALELARDQHTEFHRGSGLPRHLHLAQQPNPTGSDALELARAVLAAEWPHWSPGNRKSRVETMSCVLAALADPLPRGLTVAHARRALRDLLLPPAGAAVTDLSTLEAEVRTAAEWLPAHMPAVTALTVQRVNEALPAACTQLDGTLYAGDRIGATRGSFSLLCAEAVDRGLLTVNPVRDARRVRAAKATVAEAGDADPEEQLLDRAVVDERRVLSVEQARAMVARIAQISPVSWRMVALFTLLYTTGMRPSEALGIRNNTRLHLPDAGWGRVVLWRPTVDAGGARWTGTGATHADKLTLKARKEGVERTVPLPPEAVAALRTHIERAGIARGGRLFVNTNGSIYTLAHLGKVWRSARRALHPVGPLSTVSLYECRHTYVTAAIHAGIALPKIASVVGNSPPTIMRTYARVLSTNDEQYIEQLSGVFGG